MLPLIKRSNHYFVIIIIITTLIRLICLHKTLQDNSLLSVQPRSSAVNMTLPAFAAKRRAAAPLLLGARRPPLSIDISCPHGAQQQTRRTPMLMSSDGRRTDGQTDRRAIDRSIDPAPHTMRPVWILGVMETVLYKYCNVVIVLQFVCLRRCLRLTTCSVSRFGARRRRHISTATSRHANALETLSHQRLQRCSSHSPGPTAPSAPSAARLQLSGTRYPAQCSIVSLCQRLNLSERRSHFLTHLHTTNCITKTRVEQNTAQKIGRCMTNDRSTCAYVRAN